jgi:DNA helicase TIP49 (TBP-interacting protein)
MRRSINAAPLLIVALVLCRLAPIVLSTNNTTAEWTGTDAADHSASMDMLHRRLVDMENTLHAQMRAMRMELEAALDQVG